MSAREIRDATSERLATIDFLQRALQCQTPLLNTVVIAREELSTTFSKSEGCIRRAKVFMTFGLSLGGVLDKKNLQFIDFVYAITLVSQEMETFSTKDTLPKAAVVAATRKEKTKRSLFSRSGEEFSLLTIPHFAFTPDYFHVLCTLLDVLHEVHLRIMSHLTSPTFANRGVGTSVHESYNKFTSRVKKVLASVYKDLETLAQAKINREMSRIMSGLLGDRTAQDRQNRPLAGGTASFGLVSVVSPII